MSPVALIERNRMPICIALLLIAWLSPIFSFVVHLAVFLMCAALMVASLMISRSAQGQSIKYSPASLGYKLLAVAVIVTMGFTIVNRLAPFSDLDTSGMALPLITMLVLIGPILAAGPAGATDA